MFLRLVPCRGERAYNCMLVKVAIKPNSVITNFNLNVNLRLR